MVLTNGRLTLIFISATLIFLIGSYADIGWMTALGGLTASAAILLFVLGDGIPLT